MQIYQTKVFAKWQKKETNTSISAIQKWETGEKKPSGLALKLLNIIEKKGLRVVL